MIACHSRREHEADLTVEGTPPVQGDFAPDGDEAGGIAVWPLAANRYRQSWKELNM
jgi:hypothetical protein